MSTEKLKSLIGTKFLLDKNIINYQNLIQSLEDHEFNINFATKPIRDNLDVHSLFIKPDFEVSYLVKSGQADEYYKNAGYSCISYKEIELKEVLDVLNYKFPEIKDQKEKKSKKHKYITLLDKNSDEYTFIKNKIDLFIYKDNKLEILYLNAVYKFIMSKEKYLETKLLIES